MDVAALCAPLCFAFSGGESEAAMMIREKLVLDI
jgi:hypothetical protein